MIFLLALMLQSPAPAVQQPEAAAPPNVSIERIRQGLERPGIRLTPPVAAEPVFRVQVRERPLRFAPLWEDVSMVPAYVHPRQPLEHYEFLRLVTPEEFRAGTLYPCCVDLAPLFEDAGDEFREAIRARRLRGFHMSVQPVR
jgi:hypothetical protein